MADPHAPVVFWDWVLSGCPGAPFARLVLCEVAVPKDGRGLSCGHGGGCSSGYGGGVGAGCGSPRACWGEGSGHAGGHGHEVGIGRGGGFSEGAGRRGGTWIDPDAPRRREAA